MPADILMRFFMQHLNKEATTIFCNLLNRLKDKEAVQLRRKNLNFIELTKCPGIVKMDYGIGHYYLLTSYLTLKTELYKDPELQCIVIDNRTSDDDTSNLLIYPISFQLDFIDAQLSAVLVKNEEIIQINRQLLAELCMFTEFFLRRIKDNYLDPSFFSRLFGK